MNMTVVNNIGNECLDYQCLQKTAEQFDKIFALAISSGPKDKVQEAAQAALEAAGKIGDYTAGITLKAIAERAVQLAEDYDPDVAEKRDPVNDLGLATKLLIECSLLNTVVENIAGMEVPAA
jgi:hypothetical protein